MRLRTCAGQIAGGFLRHWTEFCFKYNENSLEDFKCVMTDSDSHYIKIIEGKSANLGRI